MFFGDETSFPVDGQIWNRSLAPIGVQNVSVSAANSKETVTVFLAGIYEVSLDQAYPLPPTVIFENHAQCEESSRILKEARCYSVEMNYAIYGQVSSSGWMNLKLFEKILKEYIESTSDEHPPIAILVDSCTAHQTDALPINCDLHRIPGGCTPFIQVHDRSIICLVKRTYEKMIKNWCLSQKTHEPLNRKQILEFIKLAHDKTWTTCSATILNTIRKYVRDPLLLYPWEWKENEKEMQSSKNAAKKRQREARDMAVHADEHAEESVPEMKTCDYVPRSSVPCRIPISPALSLRLVLAARRNAPLFQPAATGVGEYMKPHVVCLSHEEGDSSGAEEVQKTSYKWKTLRRRGALIPSECVDFMCQQIFDAFMMRHPDSKT